MILLLRVLFKLNLPLVIWPVASGSNFLNCSMSGSDLAYDQSYNRIAQGSLFFPVLPNVFSPFLHSFNASLNPPSLAICLATFPSLFFGFGLHPTKVELNRKLFIWLAVSESAERIQSFTLINLPKESILLCTCYVYACRMSANLYCKGHLHGMLLIHRQMPVMIPSDCWKRYSLHMTMLQSAILSKFTHVFTHDDRVHVLLVVISTWLIIIRLSIKHVGT